MIGKFSSSLVCVVLMACVSTTDERGKESAPSRPVQRVQEPARHPSEQAPNGPREGRAHPTDRSLYDAADEFHGVSAESLELPASIETLIVGIENGLDRAEQAGGVPDSVLTAGSPGRARPARAPASRLW